MNAGLLLVDCFKTFRSHFRKIPRNHVDLLGDRWIFQLEFGKVFENCANLHFLCEGRPTVLMIFSGVTNFCEQKL